MQVDINNASTVAISPTPSSYAGDNKNVIPPSEDISCWVNTTIDSQIWPSLALQENIDVINIDDILEKDCEISIRIVDKEEISQLNVSYRNKQGPTNVLSFPAGMNNDIPLLALGDIVICAPTIFEEAKEQGKPQHAHWAHMIVHGTLHLLGFDHQTEHEAHIMETIETSILASLQIASPYLVKRV